MHQDVYPPLQPHVSDGLVQVIASKLEHLHADVAGMRDVLKELASAVTKLAVIEERQTQSAQALERAFIALEKVEARLATLERAQPLQQQTSSWVLNAMWLGAGVIAMAILKKVGLV